MPVTPLALTWFRARSRIVAALVLPPFLSATLFPIAAVAKEEGPDEFRLTPSAGSDAEAKQKVGVEAREGTRATGSAVHDVRDGAPGLDRTDASRGPASSRPAVAVDADPPQTTSPDLPGGGSVATSPVSPQAISLPSGAAT